MTSSWNESAWSWRGAIGNWPSSSKGVCARRRNGSSSSGQPGCGVNSLLCGERWPGQRCSRPAGGGGGVARGPGDLLDAFIRQFYLRRHTIPREVLTSHAVEDAEVIGRWLLERAGHRVAIRHPQRGRKARLAALAVKNAQIALMASLKSAAGRRTALKELREVLGLAHPPHRVEAFDISNIQGMWAVGSQVVFEDALSNRSQYKRYRIKTVAGAA